MKIAIIARSFFLVVGVLMAGCPDEVAGRLIEADINGPSFECDCTLILDEENTFPGETIGVQNLCASNRGFCDAQPEVEAGCPSKTFTDPCQEPRCPDLEERREDPQPLTGAARLEYLRWALKCADVDRRAIAPEVEDACSEAGLECEEDGDCPGNRGCANNGTCRRCQLGRTCAPLRCVAPGDVNAFDGYCEIECTLDSDCPVGRGACTDGQCGGCRDGFVCEEERQCMFRDPITDANVDAAFDRCPVEAGENGVGCAVHTVLELCTGDDPNVQCLASCKALAYLMDSQFAAPFLYSCGDAPHNLAGVPGDGQECATFNEGDPCPPNTGFIATPREINGNAKECELECGEDPEVESFPRPACQEREVACTEDSDCPIDENFASLACLETGFCEERPCPDGFECSEGALIAAGQPDGTLRGGNLCLPIGCSATNLDTCTQVRIGERPNTPLPIVGGTLLDCHAGFESLPLCRMPTEDPPVLLGGPLAEVGGISKARIDEASSLHVTLAGQTATTAIHGVVDVIGRPCPGESCNVSIRIIATADPVVVSACALPPFDSCQSDDDCPSSGFQVPCLLGGCADFSGFCEEDEDCPLLETQVSCLAGVPLDDITIHAGTGNNLVIPLNDEGVGEVPPFSMSGTFRIDIDGVPHAATGVGLGQATRVEVDWLNKTVRVVDDVTIGPLTTRMEITAAIENLAPVAFAPREVEARCTGQQGTPVALVGHATDFDGVDDLFLIGWWQGFASPQLLGQPLAPGSSTATAYAPLGRSLYSFRVQDRQLQESIATTMVTVTNDPPTAVISVAPTVECTSPDGALVHFSAAATFDPDGSAPLTADWRIGSPDGPVVATGVEVDVQLPLGMTEVFATVLDPCGKRDTTSAAVLVEDTTAPVVTSLLFDGPNCLWPPRHQYAVLDLERDVDATVVDACDPSPRLVFAVATSNEPDNGLGDGDTANDIVLFDDHVCLRAERSGTGEGRTYTVHIEAIDAAGNAGDPTLEIHVPHEQSAANRCRETAREHVRDGSPRCAAGG